MKGSQIKVRLASLLCGFLAGGIMGAATIPAAYIERGYWAIGGEWLGVVAAAVMASTLVYPKMRRVFCQEPHCVKGARAREEV